MLQNVTLSAKISPPQALAVTALVNGSTVTEAAERAGVSRVTVSRWVHHDPEFIAELQNTRAEMAAQTRCALETLGNGSVAALREAVEGKRVWATKLTAACAVLKLLGADRAETIRPTTAEEVRLRLQEREQELRQSQSRLDANARDVIFGRPIDVVIRDSEAALTAPDAG
jgi:hypothetical protein